MPLEFIIIVLAITIITSLFIIVLYLKKKDSFSKGFAEGSIFDNYRINFFVKRGGMANIYNATNVKTNETVALKIMHNTLTDDEDLIYKFLREGDILEQLNRKYPDAPIVKVYRHSRENNDPNGIPFLAMEFIEGEDLDTIMKETTFDVNTSINIVYSILQCLGAAHREGIWHRDISPGNVMIKFNGEEIESIKIIDFGVAKNEYMGRHTPDGSIHGKPPFMSPEQCRNEKVDGRSDIYSLGILFYTMLNGKPPFISKNPLEVMSMHQFNKLHPLPTEVPDYISSIIYQMLEKNLQSRYQTVEEVISDLDIIFSENPDDHEEKTIVENEEFEEQNINDSEQSESSLDIDEVNNPSVENTILDENNYNANQEPKTLSERKLNFENRKKVDKKNKVLTVLLSAITLTILVIIVYVIASIQTGSDTPKLTSRNLPKKLKGLNVERILNDLRECNIKIEYNFIEQSTLQNKQIISPDLVNWSEVEQKGKIELFISSNQ